MEEEQEAQRQAERLRARQDIQAQLQQRGALQGAAQARCPSYRAMTACRKQTMWYSMLRCNASPEMCHSS